MSHRILLTGSEGLVGGTLRATLEAREKEIVGLGLRGAGSEYDDVRHSGRVR